VKRGWAELNVVVDGMAGYVVLLSSDLDGDIEIGQPLRERAAAIARARAWSRRLGYIPVEVEDE
jgi:hypothetical protein